MRRPTVLSIPLRLMLPADDQVKLTSQQSQGILTEGEVMYYQFAPAKDFFFCKKCFLNQEVRCTESVRVP
jgi:hypothetical protein